MTLISIKEYAANNNISYEAVRQQVVRYADELGEHLIKDGRQQFLDEEAVAFLDSKRQKNPVVVYQAAKDEQIQALREENESILRKLVAVQDALIEERIQHAELKEKSADVALLERKAASLEESAKADAKRHRAEVEALEGIHQRELQEVKNLHVEEIRIKDELIAVKELDLQDTKARLAVAEEGKQELEEDLNLAAKRLIAAAEQHTAIETKMIKIREKTLELDHASIFQRRRILKELKELQE